MSALLTAENLAVKFFTHGGSVNALDDVSIEIQQGKTLGVVGESGCGKTTLARVILGLQPTINGAVKMHGQPITRKGLAEKIGIVWQDPYASLDPRWTIGRTMLEPARLYNRPVDLEKLMQEVGLNPELAKRYPHQLSGGQRQRVAIGRALSLRPPLVILDEPTAALDLSIQAQILNLLKDIQDELGCAYLYISHDLATVRFMADRVAVMQAGKIVEQGDTEQVLGSPEHEYTKSLLASAPNLLFSLAEPT